MNRLILVLIASLAVTSLEAKDASIAGTWTFTVEHLGVKLVFEQNKSAITGTLDWPHGDPITLTGAFADDRVTLFGSSASDNFTIHIVSTGVRKADGSLAGTLKVHFDEFNDARQLVRVRDQEIPWTAVRGLHNVMRIPRG